MTTENRVAVEHLQSLREHPGFQEFLKIGRDAILVEWENLLNAMPSDVPRLQGFIAGANFILEIVDGSLRDARILAEQQRVASERTTEEALSRARQFSVQRSERRVGVGATI